MKNEKITETNENKDTLLVEFLHCSKCGEHITNYTKYCPMCGNKLEWGQGCELDNNYWTSKDGTIHEFKDMSDEHLANAIELLKRGFSVEELKDTELFKGLSIEFCSRGILKKYIDAYKYVMFRD